MDKTNLQLIRESFGRVVYSHKTHEKAAEIEGSKATKIKWANVIMTTLTSGSLLSTILTNQAVLMYISALLSASTLAFIIFQLSFNPEELAEKHRQLAKELWYMRERYVNFIADIKNEKLNEDEIISRRDQTIEELRLIYKFAPATDSIAYKKAQKALKLDEELTFSNEEIDNFLPEALRIH